MSQKSQIYAYLKRGKKITALQALHKFECMCLAERCRDLRNEGVPVKTEMVKTKSGKHIASYHL